MARTKIILAALAAFFLHLSPADANDCVSVDKFHSTVSSQGITLYGSVSAATKRMEKLLNENRAKGGRAPVEASIFLAGYVKDDKGEIVAIVAVFDPDELIPMNGA